MLHNIIIMLRHNSYTGPGGFDGLTGDGRIAVASLATAFIVGSVLFFITGFLCGHYCRKEKTWPLLLVSVRRQLPMAPHTMMMWF